jgi:hypothetical protein
VPDHPEFSSRLRARASEDGNNSNESLSFVRLLWLLLKKKKKKKKKRVEEEEEEVADTITKVLSSSSLLDRSHDTR